jgi:hypothetical protein
MVARPCPAAKFLPEFGQKTSRYWANPFISQVFKAIGLLEKQLRSQNAGKNVFGCHWVFALVLRSSGVAAIGSSTQRQGRYA